MGETGSNVSRVFGTEVLQRSSLRDFQWPEADPFEVDQPTQLSGPSEVALLAAAARAVRFDFEAFCARMHAASPAEQIHQLITSAAFNFNGVERVRAEPLWRDRIARAVAAGRAVEIAYPLMCKIGNPAKVRDALGATTGELACLHFFGHLAELVSRIYPPGVRLRIASDASLYNSAQRNPAPEISAYLSTLREMVRGLELTRWIEIHDFSDILADQISAFRPAYQRYYGMLREDPAQLVDGELYGRLLRSTEASIQTEHFGMSYADLREVFGPTPNPKSPFATEIASRAREALADKLAVKLAADEIGALENAFPGHVRASCHKGLKHGRAVLGLRVYPEYYRSAKLLPYHGRVLIERRRSRQVLIILPEILLRGRMDLVRIVDDTGSTQFYRATE